MRRVVKLPVILLSLIVVVMIVLDAVVPGYEIVFPGSFIIASVSLTFGFIIIAICGYSFRRAQTTVNPVTPEKSTQLVITGMYRYSRNPMYIGFLAWLIAAIFYIGNIVNLLFVPLFIMAVNKLYILPEEAALEKLFTEDFKEYRKRVRRWL